MHFDSRDAHHFVPSELSRSERSLQRRADHPNPVYDSLAFAGTMLLTASVGIVALVVAFIAQINYWAGNPNVATFTPVLILWLITAGCAMVVGPATILEGRTTNAPKLLARKLMQRSMKVDDDVALVALREECRKPDPLFEFLSDYDYELFRQVLDSTELVNDYLTRTITLRNLLNDSRSGSDPEDVQTAEELRAKLHDEARELVTRVKTARDEEQALAERQESLQAEAERIADAQRAEVQASEKAAAAAVWRIQADAALGRVRDRAS